MTLRLRKINSILAGAVLLLCIAVTAFSQDGYFRRITINEGVSREVINHLLQDDTGYIWIASDSGLYRWDGYTARSIYPGVVQQNGTVIGPVQRLALSNGTDIWFQIGLDTIGIVDGRTLETQFYSLPNEQVFNPESISAILKPSSTEGLLVATNGGSFYHLHKQAGWTKVYSTERLNTRLLSNTITSAVEKADGTILFTLEGFGPLRADVQFDSVEILRPPNMDNLPFYSTLSKAPAGDIYLFDETPNVWKYDDGDDEFKVVSAVELLAEHPVSSYAAGHDQDIWFSADGRIYQYLINEGERRQFSLRRSTGVLPARILVSTILIDRGGTVFAGTDWGLFSYSEYGNKFQSVSFEAIGLNAATLALDVVVTSENILWIGSQGEGLVRYDYKNNSTTHIQLTRQYPQCENTVLAIEQVGDDLLIGTPDLGLLQYSTSTDEFQRLTDFFQVTDIEAGNDRFYFATYVNGIGIYDPATGDIRFWEPSPSARGSVGSFNATCLLLDSKDNLWVGSDRLGLYRLFPDRERYNVYREDAAIAGSLSSDAVTDIHEDGNGTIWIATRNGLNRLEPEGRKFTSWHVSDGLPNRTVTGVSGRGTEQLWISTASGLARYSIANDTWNRYGVLDGLQEVEFLPDSIDSNNSGVTVFGGISSCYYVDSSDIISNPHIPNVVISNVTTANPVVSRVVRKPDMWRVKIPHLESGINFEVAALDFASPEQNRYRYRLINYSDNWQDLENVREISFSRLPPGNFILQVQGSNNDSVWSPPTNVAELIVTPPFWMTWEFRLFLFLAILALGITIYRYRVNEIKKRSAALSKEVAERRVAQAQLEAYQIRLRSLASKLSIAEEIERRRLASALHDDIGHALFLSKVRLSNLKGNLDDEQTVSEVSEMIELVDETLQNTRNLTVEISPPSLYKIGLVSALEGLLERFGKKHNIQTIITGEVDVNLNQDVAVLLYQSVRELLVNVLKHAAATRIMLAISSEKDVLLLSLEDNGCGFDVSLLDEDNLQSSGYGVFSIRERMDSIGGKFVLDSQPGSGTTVTLAVPVTREGGEGG